MSISDRLFVLAQQYRDRHGPAALADAGRMISVLSSQAPDLHGEIRALAAAIAANAAGRIAQAADPQGESRAIAGRIAADHTLPLASVAPAIDVAARLGPVAAASPPPDGGWAGDTVIAAQQPGPPSAPPPPAREEGIRPDAPKPPAWQNKWAVGAAVAALLLIGYQQFGQQAPAPDAGTPQMPAGPGAPNAPTDPNAPTPPGMPSAAAPAAPAPSVPTGPNPPAAPAAPASGQQFPALASPNGPQPVLMVQSAQNGFMVGFSLNGVAGMVASPQGGWDNGPGSIMLSRNPQSNQPDSVGGGRFQAIHSGGNPARVMQVQWQQDNVGIGAVCVAFIGTGGQDVNPRGARMCIMDGACNRPLGCGQLPSGQ